MRVLRLGRAGLRSRWGASSSPAASNGARLSAGEDRRGGGPEPAWLGAGLVIETPPERRPAAADQAAAGRAWAAVDAAAAERVPLVPLATSRAVSIISTRLGNIIWHPYFGILLDQLWVCGGGSP
jgi:hypothetical protein